MKTTINMTKITNTAIAIIVSVKKRGDVPYSKGSSLFLLLPLFTKLPHREDEQEVSVLLFFYRFRGLRP